MDRKEFVIAYTLKNTRYRQRVYCLSCYLQRKNKIYGITDFINRSCRNLVCVGQSNGQKDFFDNTKHIPIITIKECKHLTCDRDCNQCVITYRHNVRRV